MSTVSNVAYPFDPTGAASTNLITGEQHPVQEFNYEDFYLIVPLQAPFFTNNLLVQYSDPATPLKLLQEGVDYNLVLPYWAATRSIGLPVYGGILILNTMLTGTVEVNYQTIGGIWCSDQQTVLKNLTEQMYNPRAVLWDVITNVQQTFPPVNHSLSIDNTYGLDTLNTEISNLAAAIAAKPVPSITFAPGGGGSSQIPPGTYAPLGPSGLIPVNYLPNLSAYYAALTNGKISPSAVPDLSAYYVPLGPGNTIPAQYIPLSIIPPSIFGPNTLNTNATGTYTISNYNSQVSYVVNAASGTVTISGATVTYIAPATASTAGFTINGNTIPVTITTPGTTPTIIGPTSLLEGTAGTYTISNYNASLTYTVTAVTGTVSVNQATITYTAPSTAGTSGFVINGITVNVVIVAPSTPMISGPSTSPVNSAVEFTITNYVAGAIYPVSATVGTVSINQATITYNTPATAGQGGFTVSGISVPVNIIAAYINTPTVTSPTANSSSLQLTLTATSSAFQASGMTDTQLAANWQLATDAAFTTIVQQSINSTTNLASWIISNLSANQTYYIRVQYIGHSGATSLWSTPNQFATKTYATPQSILQSITSATTESAANMQFGQRIAIDDAGVTAVISAPNMSSGNGAIYIFKNTGGTWAEVQKITPPEVSATSIFFGQGLDISADGNTIVVGAYRVQVGSNYNEGSGYIYTFNGTSFVLATEIFPTGTLSAAYLNFGVSASINSNGTVVVFGADIFMQNNAPGVAFIYTGSGSTWTLTAAVQAGDLTSGDEFGASVALSPDGATLIIGAPNKTVLGNSSQGTVYIFQNTTNGWSQTAELFSPVNDVNQNFGTSVAIDQGANTIIVSSPGTLTTGRCYIYTYSTTTSWSLSATLIPSDLTTSSNFGRSVAMSLDGTTVIIGAATSTVNTFSNIGEVYIFQNTVNGWQQLALFQPTVASYINIYFGQSVAIDGTGSLAIAGAIGTKSSLYTGQGNAYILG